MTFGAKLHWVSTYSLPLFNVTTYVFLKQYFNIYYNTHTQVVGAPGERRRPSLGALENGTLAQKLKAAIPEPPASMTAGRTNSGIELPVKGSETYVQ